MRGERLPDEKHQRRARAGRPVRREDATGVVYLLNPIPENGFGDEIAAMQPEVLHGDLSAIG